MNNIQNEIAQLWALALEYEKVEVARNYNFQETLNSIEDNNVTECLKSLEPWISIFNEGIQWLSNLHITLTPDFEGNSKKDDNLLVPYILSGNACVHSVAIRRLVLSGLDSSAKILLRSLMETLNVCIAVMADASLSYQFRKAQDSKVAKNLWFREFSAQKMTHILTKIESEMGINETYIETLRNWRIEIADVTSQYVHPSYLTSFISSLPFSLSNPGYCVLHGIYGASSCLSIRTLGIACKLIWYFSNIGLPLLLKLGPDSGPPLRLISSDKNGAAVLIGAEIYDELILRHTDEDKTPDIFEEDIENSDN